MYARVSSKARRTRKAYTPRKALLAVRKATAQAVRSLKLRAAPLLVCDRWPVHHQMVSAFGPIGIRTASRAAQVIPAVTFNTESWKVDFPKMWRSFYLPREERTSSTSRRSNRVFLHGVTVTGEVYNRALSPNAVRIFYIRGSKRTCVASVAFGMYQDSTQLAGIPGVQPNVGGDLPSIIIEGDPARHTSLRQEGSLQVVHGIGAINVTQDAGQNVNNQVFQQAINRLAGAVRDYVMDRSHIPMAQPRLATRSPYAMRMRRPQTTTQHREGHELRSNINLYSDEGGHILHYDTPISTNPEQVPGQYFDPIAVTGNANVIMQTAAADGFSLDLTYPCRRGTDAAQTLPWNHPRVTSGALAMAEGQQASNDVGPIRDLDVWGFNVQGVNAFCGKMGHLLPWQYGDPQSEAFGPDDWRMGFPGYAFGDYPDLPNIEQIGGVHFRSFGNVTLRRSLGTYGRCNTTIPADATQLAFQPPSYQTIPDSGEGSNEGINTFLSVVQGTDAYTLYSARIPGATTTEYHQDLETARFRSFMRPLTRCPYKCLRPPRVKARRVITITAPAARTKWFHRDSQMDAAARTVYGDIVERGYKQYRRYIPINKWVTFSSEEAYSALQQHMLMICGSSLCVEGSLRAQWHWSE